MPCAAVNLFYPLWGERRFCSAFSLFLSRQSEWAWEAANKFMLAMPLLAVQNLSSSESLTVGVTITIEHAGNMELVRRLFLRQEF